jgi:acetyl-CoA carboxylase beta subunit
MLQEQERRWEPRGARGEREYMSWFKRQEKEIEANTAEKNVRTEGLWQKCEGCGQLLFKADLEANLQVCPKCGHHLRLDARSRIASLLEYPPIRSSSSI